MSTPARILMVEGDTVPPSPTAGQVLLYAKTNNTFYSLNSLGVETPLGGGAPGVTSVAASGNNGITVSGSPITTSGTLTFGLGNITPTSVASTGTISGSNFSGSSSGINTGDQTSVTGNAGTATTLQTGRTLSITGDLTWTSPSFNGSTNVTAAGTLATVNSNVGTFGSATQVPVFTVDAKGRITAVSNVSISGGSGTVTSVAATGSADITVGGSPITTSGTLTFSLANTTVTPATYGDATNVPQLTVDAKGRITGVTNVPITGGSSEPEIVVFNYGSGGSGNFTPVDAIYSQTSGVTATVTDGANCIATYAFTGKSNPPKSITTYGQVYGTNEFTIKDTTSLPSAKVAGGGTAAAPDIRTAFSATNIVTLQTRMSDTGASAGLGQRAWLLVIFGF